MSDKNHAANYGNSLFYRCRLRSLHSPHRHSGISVPAPAANELRQYRLNDHVRTIPEPTIDWTIEKQRWRVERYFDLCPLFPNTRSAHSDQDQYLSPATARIPTPVDCSMQSGLASLRRHSTNGQPTPPLIVIKAPSTRLMKKHSGNAHTQ